MAQVFYVFLGFFGSDILSQAKSPVFLKKMTEKYKKSLFLMLFFVFSFSIFFIQKYV